MTTHMRRMLAVVATLVLFLGLLPGVAQASLDDWPNPVGTSSTNPSPGPTDPSYADYWWRQGWGNDLEPQLAWNLPKDFVPAIDGQILGQLYVVDRSALTIIDTNTPDAYMRSTFGDTGSGPYGTNMNTTYDMLGTLANDPASATLVPGASTFVEGQWYIHALYYSTFRYSTLTMSVPIGVDVTPPRPVAGLQVSTGPGEPAVTGVVPTTRAHITWTPDTHDDLSGDAYFQILLDDRALSSAEQGRVYSAPWLPTPSSFTIEDMPPGQHKISVVVVDRATNESTAESVYFASDPDTPTVKFTSPLNGTFGVHTIMSAEASDSAGNPTVVFGIDGGSVATLTAPPYSFRPDLSTITTGTHVLTATATDSYGRSVTVTQTVSTTSLPGSLGFLPSDWESLNSALGGGLADGIGTNGWENNLRPRLQIPSPAPDPRYPDEGVINGILYVVDKSADTTIDITAPEHYFHQAWLNPASPLQPTIDLLSVLNFPPLGGWPPLLPGENAVAEGQWYLHYAPITSGGFASPVTQVVPFRIDMTNPTPVSGLVVSPSANASDAGTWTSGSRAHVSWTHSVYDDLAGLWFYEVTVDGEPVTGGRIEGGLSSFTIEDMPAGTHAVGVRVVDNAGNVGSIASADFLSDPDTPTVVLTSPLNGTLNRFTVVSANASDEGGNPTVVFALDGASVATITAPPYSFTPDMSTLTGGAHVLSATATDHMGRSVTTTTPVNVVLPSAGLEPGPSGALDATLTGVCLTNPDNPLDPNGWWRQTWGNTLRPQFSVQVPSANPSLEGWVTGLIYTVDKDPNTAINLDTPELYARSSRGDSTNMDASVDMLGVISDPPLGGWPPLGTGENSIAEGVWYFHYTPFTTMGFASSYTRSVKFSVDLTAPRAVAGMTASPVTTPTSWAPSSRVKLSWTPGVYDDLSGVAYYRIFIDSVPIDANSSQGRLYDIAGKLPSTYTIENAPAGQHTFSIAAVDRAGNQGPLASAVFRSDPDIPRVTFLSPLNGFLNSQSMISVDASDLAGNPVVTFGIDGVTTATVSAPPYSFKPDISGLVPGVHLLSATATDFYGRAVTATLSVTSVSTTSSAVGGFEPSDSGVLDDKIPVSSVTNPIPPADTYSEWRLTWGNTLHPMFAITPPTIDPVVDGVIQGMLYTIDKSASTTIDISHPDQYFRASRGIGTNLDTSLDLEGTLAYPPVGGWPALGIGESSTAEGQWYLHYTLFTTKGYAGGITHDVPFKVDITKPRGVNNLTSSPTTNPADGGVWTTATRAHIAWTPGFYDDLSGVAFYRVYVDGVALDSDPAQGRVWELADKTPSSFTVENMPAGLHHIGVAAVDRAGNEGPLATTDFMSDPSAPTVSITSPSNGIIDNRTTIGVNAFDTAGDPTVVLSLDGSVLATLTTSPYTFTPDITTLPTGAHVLSATATDHLGRSVTATLAVTVNGPQPGFESDPSGALDGPVGASSLTNPNDAGNASTWWREGWGNSLEPQISVGAPGVDPNTSGYVVGTLYTVDKTESTSIDIHHPELYSRSSRLNGTNTDTTIDLLGVQSVPPVGGWPALGPGETSVSEGTWYYHVVFFSSKGYAGTITRSFPLRIDLTKPRAVAGLSVTPATTTSAWASTARATLNWTPGTYDDLSGVAFYRVYLDGVALDTSAVQGRVYEVAGKSPSTFTLENMPAGHHTLSVSCVDRATNEGPLRTVDFYSDPDTPTITLISPTNHKISARTAITVDANDEAGNPRVVFRIDGVTTATVLAPPYTFQPNITGLSSGVHTITVTAYDHLLRMASVTTTVTKASVAAGFLPSENDALNGPMTGTSSTNPNDSGSITTWWRNGWGNTLQPQFTINAPAVSPDEGYVIGMLYTIDRTQTTAIDISRPDLYSRASRATGTNLNTTIDLQGVLDYPPAGGWPAPGPGEVLPGEGLWYMHFAPFTSDGYASATTHYISIGVDLTKPRVVNNLVVSPSLSPADANQWVETSRAIVTWSQGIYDDLSGVAYYQVYIDGVPVDDTQQGHVFEVAGKTPNSYTIENMPSGMHKVSVAAVDRAGNIGPQANGYFYADPDVPTIAFGTFNRTVGIKPNFTVKVSDKGGVRYVRYTLDGQLLGTITDSPYDIHPDLSGFSSGSHVLTAMVSDQYGHTAQVSTTIKLDKSPMTISNYSRTPSIFYPILRDGYYDYSYIKFTTNKAATATLTIRNSAGATVRTIKANVTAGAHTLKWDGKWSKDSKAHTGTYNYQVTAVDAIGQKAVTGKLYTTIRNYQIVKTSSNTVKVIPR